MGAVAVCYCPNSKAWEQLQYVTAPTKLSTCSEHLAVEGLMLSIAYTYTDIELNSGIIVSFHFLESVFTKEQSFVVSTFFCHLI